MTAVFWKICLPQRANEVYRAWCVCVCVLPETGAVGSAGCSTDSCLNTAYLSEEEEDEDPDTGVSMAGTLYEADKTYTSQSKQIKVFLQATKS